MAASSEGLLLLNSTNLVTNSNAPATAAPYNRLLYTFSAGQTLTTHEIAMDSISVYYSWPNLSKTFYNNADYSYQWVDGATYPVAMPQGLYTVTDINSYLQFVMQTNGHYLVTDTGQFVFYASWATNSVAYGVSWLSSVIPTTLPAGWTAPTGTAPAWYTAYSGGGVAEGPQLIISTSNFQYVVGFLPGSYPASGLPTANYVATSTVAPELSPVSSVIVSCSLTSFSVSLTPQAIFSFSPTVGFGSQIYIDLAKYCFLPVTPGTYSQFTISLTDQLGNPLPVLDSNLVLTLALRRRR